MLALVLPMVEECGKRREIQTWSCKTREKNMNSNEVETETCSKWGKKQTFSISL
jgi:hypothetical protein